MENKNFGFVAVYDKAAEIVDKAEAGVREANSIMEEVSPILIEALDKCPVIERYDKGFRAKLIRGMSRTSLRCTTKTCQMYIEESIEDVEKTRYCDTFNDYYQKLQRMIETFYKEKCSEEAEKEINDYICDFSQVAWDKLHDLEKEGVNIGRPLKMLFVMALFQDAITMKETSKRIKKELK